MGVQLRILGVAVAVLLVGAGCGGGSDHNASHGSAAEASRTVDVTMKDIAYDPPALTVKAGETVKFVFHNLGQIRHDAFLGDEAAQAEHEMEMRKEGSGGMNGHGSADAITVDPGKTGELTHTFKAGDAIVIGCHEVGHYAAGMKLPVTII
ncbi:MAG TPA: cupredoxin domain-containing protein [Acidimicrobiia bacterium]|nr:cupredoxin domain-containing protein [Acidimicrobiia bacterium]